jgi:hypothetical protein
MKLKDSPTFKPAQHIAWRRVKEEAVLLDTRTSVYYSLNDSAARAWELLGEGLPPAGVAERLSGEFAVAPETAANDVQTLVKQLEAEKLLVRAA